MCGVGKPHWEEKFNAAYEHQCNAPEVFIHTRTKPEYSVLALLYGC